MTDCPCCSGRELAACCGPYLSGEAVAPTAEALMRSRYSAFVTVNVDYLHDTLAPEARHDFDHAETEAWAKSSKWQGLTINATEAGGEGDETGTVDFTASYRSKGQPFAHRELGSFRREGGRWLYVDGQIGGPRQATQQRTGPKVGRNDPCPCGSGKKYKKCCGE